MDMGHRAMSRGGKDGVAAHFLACMQDLVDKVVEPNLMGDFQKRREAISGLLRAFDFEHYGSGQIHVDNDPEWIECEISEWGEVIDIRVAIPQTVSFFIRKAKLVVVHLEFNLVNL